MNTPKQSKMRKTLTSFFIFHPWGFILFLLFGAGLFIFTTSKIRIPVYTTIKATINQRNGVMKLSPDDKIFKLDNETFNLDLDKEVFKINNKIFKSDTPIFLYQSRDDHLEKVTKYHISNSCLIIDSINTLPNTGKIYIDIQTDEISLLRHIFTEGGNT